jgi:hypothetical protein
VAYTAEEETVVASIELAVVAAVARGFIAAAVEVGALKAIIESSSRNSSSSRNVKSRKCSSRNRSSRDRSR